jgi:hypothetical protein
MIKLEFAKLLGACREKVFDLSEPAPGHGGRTHSLGLDQFSVGADSLVFLSGKTA